MFPHTVWSGPAVTTGAGGIVILTFEDTEGQAPLGAEVNVRVTEPAFCSPIVGPYIAFNVVLFGENVPAPPLHVPGEPEPANCTGKSLVHTVWLGPAFTDGAVVNVTTMVSLTSLHKVLPVVVRYKLILPNVISAAEGL